MLVVCFHQKIPTGLNFTTFAPGLLLSSLSFTALMLWQTQQRTSGLFRKLLTNNKSFSREDWAVPAKESLSSKTETESSSSTSSSRIISKFTVVMSTSTVDSRNNSGQIIALIVQISPGDLLSTVNWAARWCGLCCVDQHYCYLSLYVKAGRPTDQLLVSISTSKPISLPLKQFSSAACNGQVGMWRPILWTSK